jgi:AbiJ N-terminal domain 4
VGLPAFGKLSHDCPFVIDDLAQPVPSGVIFARQLAVATVAVRAARCRRPCEEFALNGQVRPGRWNEAAANRPANGSDVKLRGQGPRGYGRAARRLPACEAREAGGVPPSNLRCTSRLGRRAEAGPRQLLRRVGRPPLANRFHVQFNWRTPLRFSQRMGLQPLSKALQIDQVDEELRNGLWSIFHELVLKHFEPSSRYYPARGDELAGSNLEVLFFSYWFDLFERPTDTIPEEIDRAINAVRKWFFTCEWYDLYYFLEITVDRFDSARDLQRAWNAMLEKHNAAYRLVDAVATKITSEIEVAAIESALDAKLKGVTTHLRSSLEKLADRKSPDYRNSVKESISAVESLAQTITGNARATLGDALKILGPAIGMHGAFREALSKLYGYTSDADGIRHAILEEPTVTHADALFMLVTCSAFVNYVIAQAAAGKIQLKNR